MKHTQIISALSTFALLFSNSAAFASSSNNDLTATAKIVPSCTINAENVNFGVLSSPLSAQSANSQMHVLCNNNASYKIDLAYGGIYGSGSGSGTNSDYSLKYFKQYNPETTYTVYEVYKGNSYIGQFNCNINGTVWFYNAQTAKLYGYANGYIWYKDTLHTCKTDGTIAGTMPATWVGAFNASGFQPFGGAYAYGIMSGAVNKNSVAYSISVPNDSSKVWNAGNNSYSATGTGSNQNIPINAKIVPDKSTSLFPAQDFYLDTVTAVINF